jgi:probable phosphoglycerate mutase
MPAATTFYLVRHAAYDLLGRVLAGRMRGVSLSETGRQQAEAVADALASRQLAAVISSPQPRALETASPIAARHGLEPQMEQALDEIDFGDWTGMRFDELAARADWRAFNTFRAMALVPGGETMQQAQTRAINAILRLRATFPGQAVVVVSHGDIIKSVIAHVLAVPLDLFRRIEISPASCSMLVLEDEDVRIEAVNLPPSIG